MRNILAALLLVATVGCRSAGAPSAGPAAASGTSAALPPGAPASSSTDVGATDGAGAVERFLGAAKAADAPGMARVFGTRAGPIASRESADAVEKRMRALQCYLAHDSARFVGASDGIGNTRVLVVELRQRELVRQTRFVAVPTSQRRWFVESFEINTLSDFCRP